MSPLLTLIMLFPALSDLRGRPIPIRDAIRATIASVADGKWEAAALYVLVSHESAGHVDAVGDSGASCGAFQTPCAETPGFRPCTLDEERDASLCTKGQHFSGGPGVALAQTRLAKRILERAIVGCVDHPIWMYASGRCVSTATARRYEAEIQMVLDKSREVGQP